MAILIKILNDPKKMFLYFLALVFLIVNAYYNLATVRSINGALLEEKRVETSRSVDMLCAGLEAAPEGDAMDVEKRVRGGAEFLDALPYTYAAAFRLEDGNHVLISERVRQTGFDPFLSESFNSAISSLDKGGITVGFEPENGAYRDVEVYFRWTPSYASGEERYLIVTGVTRDSVSSGIPAIFTIGQWISTIVMAILFLMFIWLNACLGYIWLVREKEPWRERWGEGWCL
ncbi:MAG: hypothetical protein LBU86_03785 [Oscillospiraceae bacterium]|nr:hypothetical protein [Oscillospiraceae bacterium]